MRDEAVAKPVDAFMNGVNVTNVVLGAGVESVGKDAFLWCNSLGTIRIGRAPDEIAGLDDAFTVVARITMVAGQPVVDVVPKVEIDGYVQKFKAKRALNDATWDDVADPADVDPAYHFFKIEFVKGK